LIPTQKKSPTRQGHPLRTATGETWRNVGPGVNWAHKRTQTLRSEKAGGEKEGLKEGQLVGVISTLGGEKPRKGEK